MEFVKYPRRPDTNRGSVKVARFFFDVAVNTIKKKKMLWLGIKTHALHFTCTDEALISQSVSPCLILKG